MDIQIISFQKHDSDLFIKALKIREQVFVLEQGVDMELEYQGDDDATQYLVFECDKAIATARWRRTEKGIKLERFAVLPERRNSGIGKIILDRILSDLLQYKLPIYLHAQEKAVRFYFKNGFVVVGDAFTEADIKHFRMILK